MSTARKEGITTLYHYQGGNLEHLKDTLVYSRVRCSHPEQLNDPWDCSPYFDDREIPESREAWRKLYSSQIVPNLPPGERTEAEAVLANWREHDKVVEWGIQTLTLKIQEWIAKSYRIYSLTPHPDSLLMWAHCGEKHKGLCLEFNAQLHFGRAYKVSYEDTLPLISPNIATDGHVLIGPMFCTKSTEWRYEDEYRLVLGVGAESPPALKIEVDYLVLPPGVLQGIVIGYEADAAAIRALVQEHAPNLRIKRAIRRFREYHLDIVNDNPEWG